MADPELIGMPLIGYGTWQISEDKIGPCLTQALDAGYKHIDCAFSHGNEAEIGPYFSCRLDMKNTFITSKLGSDFHQPHNVRPAFLKTCDNLRRETLDLYLINNPARTDMRIWPLWMSKDWIQETWREMVRLKEEGLVKHVGVSNFTIAKMEWLIDSELIPENNQVELHPYLPQDNLVRYCREWQIVVSAYSPLGSYKTDLKARGNWTQPYPVLMEDPILQGIAKKYNTSVAAVCLKWGLMRDTPVIVRSTNPQHMAENLKANSLELSEADFNIISNIYPKTRFRYYDYRHFCPPGIDVAEFWDDQYYE